MGLKARHRPTPRVVLRDHPSLVLLIARPTAGMRFMSGRGLSPNDACGPKRRHVQLAGVQPVESFHGSTMLASQSARLLAISSQIFESFSFWVALVKIGLDCFSRSDGWTTRNKDGPNGRLISSPLARKCADAGFSFPDGQDILGRSSKVPNKRRPATTESLKAASRDVRCARHFDGRKNSFIIFYYLSSKKNAKTHLISF